MRIRPNPLPALRRGARGAQRRLGAFRAGTSDRVQRGAGEPAPHLQPARPLRQRQPERFIDILVCPRCRARFAGPRPDGLVCTGCGYTYQIVDGVPVLFPEPERVTVMPLDHRSNPVSEEMVRWLESVGGYSLNLGAGATEFVLDRCVELEHAIFRNTDVVGDAHRLPFADDVFEAVLCLNTFEHLREPRAAAGELLRVMRPGGRLVLKTAFLQPVHEEPFHFYDATEYGVLAWFEGFDVERCFVPTEMSPALALGWFATELLHYAGKYAGPAVSRRLEASTLAEWRHLWAEADARKGDLWEAVQAVPEDVQRRFSAGFQLEATKPG